MKEPAGKISVVIPFLGGQDRLGRCLRSIAEQSYPRSAIEVLVVNNGDESVADMQAAFPGVRWLSEHIPGSYRARNRAVAASSGDVLAFTDADCAPDREWLAAGMQALQSGERLVVGGKIAFEDREDSSLNVYEVFESQRFALGNQCAAIETKRFATTANLMVARSDFLHVGYFDADLLSSGDKEWGRRAIDAGLSLRYAAAMIVRHPRRSTFRAIYGKMRRIVGGKICLMRKDRARPLAFWKELYRQSPFSPRVHWYGLFAPGITGVRRRLHFLVLVETLSVCAVVEKLRVLSGGQPFRGDPT